MFGDSHIERSFSEQCFDKKSCDYLADDEIRSKICSNHGIDPLPWWKANEDREHILSVAARNLLAIQPSSVASYSTFYHANQMLDESNLRLNDETLQSSVQLKT